MSIITLQDFLAAPNAELKKYAQITGDRDKYGMGMGTVCWVFYADDDGIAGLDYGGVLSASGVINVEVGEHDVEPGWSYDAVTGNFYDFEGQHRNLIPAETLMFLVRKDRDAKLANCDWLVNRHLSQAANAKTLTDEQFTALQTYLQALRDFPAVVDVNNIVWPIRPDFIS